MRWSAVMYIVMSIGLVLCVPVVGLLVLCLSIKLRQTLNHSDVNNVDQRLLSSQEKTVFWIIFFAYVCKLP